MGLSMLLHSFSDSELVIVVFIALALLGGLLGGLFGKRILSKHFVKAGIVA